MLQSATPCLVRFSGALALLGSATAPAPDEPEQIRLRPIFVLDRVDEASLEGSRALGCAD